MNRTVHELSLNENHWPLLPGVHEALAASLTSVNLTGDALAMRLESRLADEHRPCSATCLARPEQVWGVALSR